MAPTNLALLLAITASCACPNVAKPAAPAAPAAQQPAAADLEAERRLVVQIEGFAARACACTELPCIEREQKALDTWASEQSALTGSADATWHRQDAAARIEACRGQRPVPTDLDESLGGEPLDAPGDGGAASESDGAGAASGGAPGSGG